MKSDGEPDPNSAQQNIMSSLDQVFQASPLDGLATDGLVPQLDPQIS
jgi:hypothetical protein